MANGFKSETDINYKIIWYVTILLNLQSACSDIHVALMQVGVKVSNFFNK